MASAAAQLLDQLMGTARNSVPGDNVRELSWSDDDVCKYYLCGFCPSNLFINTKAEASVGPCYKVHDEHLKRLYEECDDSERRGYEDSFLSYLERLVRDLDKKVDRGKDRLRRSAEAKQQSLCGRGPGGQSSEKLMQLSQDIDELVLELQLLGDMGRVEETHDLMVKLEELERERETERLSLTTSAPKILAGFELDANDFHEKMELCDVCGSFLVIGDTQSRVDAHLLGKQHLGFALIRTTISELKLKKEKRFKAKQEELANRRQQEREQGSRYHRNSHRSHSKDRRTSHRSSSRERTSRQSSSHRRKRHSIKSRSSSRDKRRSRSWSRNRSTSKSRSRSRGRKTIRSRSRNRRKSRSKSRDRQRSPNKSRDRKRSRSKSRDRRRSQSKSREKRRSSKKVDEKKAEGTSREILRSRSRSKEKPKDSWTGPNGNN